MNPLNSIRKIKIRELNARTTDLVGAKDENMLKV
jgi:hypothetical protein